MTSNIIIGLTKDILVWGKLEDYMCFYAWLDNVRDYSTDKLETTLIEGAD